MERRSFVKMLFLSAFSCSWMASALDRVANTPLFKARIVPLDPEAVSKPGKWAG